MKGLIYKNILCMKKYIITLAVVLFFTVVLSIMFAFSYRYGNVHHSMTNVVVEDGASAADIQSLAKMSLLICMMLPLAVAETSIIFKGDYDASFYKMASAFPVKVSRRISAKYLTDTVFIVAGVAVDFFLVLILAKITGLFTVKEFMGGLLTFASITLILNAFVNGIVYMTGNAGAIQGASFGAVLAVVFGLILYHWKDLWLILIEDDSEALNRVFDKTMSLCTDRFYVFVLIGLVLFVGSYFLSIHFAKRKGGVA